MTFQGVLEASAAQDLSLREDGDLRFREVLIGGGEAQTQVNGAWLSLGLWGLLGLGAAGLRRRTRHWVRDYSVKQVTVARVTIAADTSN